MQRFSDLTTGGITGSVHDSDLSEPNHEAGFFERIAL